MSNERDPEVERERLLRQLFAHAEPRPLDGSPTLVRDERGQAGITGNIGLLWQF